MIDSLPLPTLQFYLASNSTADWKAYGTIFGKVPSCKEIIFGCKLHLLIVLNGTILEFVLAPANQFHLEVGFELLSEHHDLQVLGDKTHFGVEKVAQLWRDNCIRLQTIPRRNQRKQPAPPMCQLFNAVCKMIEIVNVQLSNQFHIEINHAHTI